MKKPDWIVSLADATSYFREHAESRVFYLLRHGTMRIGVYAPRVIDDQAPHDRDELYIVLEGRASIQRQESTHPCVPGDVIFVKAGEAHQFINISSDFAAWVIFWGEIGGECTNGAKMLPAV